MIALIMPTNPIMSDLSIPRAVAIDPAGAQDRDDTIWVRRAGDTFQVTVAIANVAAVVLPGSAADTSARRQGNTLYRAANIVRPMLSRTLEGRLTLGARREMPVFAIEATIASDLSVQSQLREAVLAEATVLEYDQVQAILEAAPGQLQADGALATMLAAAAQLAALLLRRRRARGALAVFDLSSGIVSTEEGTLIRLAPSQQQIGHLIVQELMILANEQLALWAAQQSLPIIYRNHQARTLAPPRESLLADLDAATAQPERFDLATLDRRLQLVLEPAYYAAHVAGHYALNLPCYTHATSPLRRYADLRTQQIVLAQLRGAPLPPLEETALICEQLNRLTLERTQEQHEWFKAQAQQRSLAVSVSEQLGGLSADEFHAALKVRLRAQQLTAAVLAEAARRFSADLAQPRDAFIILFSDGAPPELRQAVASWLDQHPEHALSLLAMLTQTEQVAATVFEETVAGADHARVFSARAQLSRADGAVSGATRSAGARKTARAQAALSLLSQLAGLEDTSIDLPVEQAAPAVPKLPPLPTATGHPVSALNEWLQVRGWAAAEYTFSSIGTASSPEYECQCVVQTAAAMWRGAGQGRTKAEAKARAAAALIAALGAP